MRIPQGRIELEVHERGGGEGPALVLLHDLYGSSAEWADGPGPWPGPVLALDFAGHGASGWHRGGAYTPELLACNVDEVLRHVGSAALVGAGVGAWVALLVAGARADAVTGALLLPGRGLAGGGPRPHFERAPAPQSPPPGCDPALAFLESDVRPVEYAAPFARKARRLLLLEDGGPRPPWWTAIADVDGVRRIASVAEGLDLLA